MEESIDRDAVIAQLQHELEQARLLILKYRFGHEDIMASLRKAAKFLTDNYILIAAIGMIVIVASYFFHMIRSLF